jgi:hypothetical protein
MNTNYSQLLPPPSSNSMYDSIQNPIINPYVPTQQKPDPNIQIYQDKSKGQQFKTAILFTILFLILSNHMSYKITNQLYQTITNRMFQVLGENGFPTFKGIIIHAIIFFAIAIFLVF